RASRPPSCTTLFPYTTLFRSLWLQHLDDVVAHRLRHFLEPVGLPRRHDDHVAFDQVVRRSALDIGATRLIGISAYLHIQSLAVRDRKSTRLNSSHRTISYAVF